MPKGHLGYLTAWPTGENQPLVVQTMNSPDGQVKANAAIIPGGDNGAVSFYPSDNTNLIVDIDGYFIPVNGGGDDLFSLTPCRVIDTRNPNGHLGGPFLSGGQQRDFPIDESTCISTNDIFGALLGKGDSMQDLVTSQPGASTILAYSFNVTVVPHNGERLGYLTVWPQGQPQPTVSTLNNPTATTVANAAIVLAGTGAGISVYPSADTDLIVDINGYFAAPASNGLMLYPAAPCRVLDTRNNGGQPFSGQKTVNVEGSPVRTSGQRRAILQRNRSAARSAGLSDAMARWTAPAAGFNVERRRWLRHLKYGSGADDEWFDRCLRIRADSVDFGYHRLFRTVELPTRGTAGEPVGGWASLLVRAVRMNELTRGHPAHRPTLKTFF